MIAWVAGKWDFWDALGLEQPDCHFMGPADRRPKCRRGLSAASTRPWRTFLVDIWAEVLGVPRVGIHDDFFALGGNSLLATQLISRLAPHVPVEIPLSSLFDRPTVAALAECIDRAKHESSNPDSLAAVLESLESMSEAEAQRVIACDDRLETTAGAARLSGASARPSAECVAGPAQQRSRERLVHENAR